MARSRGLPWHRLASADKDALVPDSFVEAIVRGRPNHRTTASNCTAPITVAAVAAVVTSFSSAILPSLVVALAAALWIGCIGRGCRRRRF